MIDVAGVWVAFVLALSATMRSGSVYGTVAVCFIGAVTAIAMLLSD